MSIFTRLWRTDPVLVGTGLFLAALTVPFGLGLLLDPRIITGAPAWLKPLKFAVSTAIYTFTLAWVFTFLPAWPPINATSRTSAAARRGAAPPATSPPRRRSTPPCSG